MDSCWHVDFRNPHSVDQWNIIKYRFIKTNLFSDCIVIILGFLTHFPLSHQPFDRQALPVGGTCWKRGLSLRRRFPRQRERVKHSVTVVDGDAQSHGHNHTPTASGEAHLVQFEACVRAGASAEDGFMFATDLGLVSPDPDTQFSLFFFLISGQC